MGKSIPTPKPKPPVKPRAYSDGSIRYYDDDDDTEKRGKYVHEDSGVVIAFIMLIGLSIFLYGVMGNKQKINKPKLSIEERLDRIESLLSVMGSSEIDDFNVIRDIEKRLNRLEDQNGI